MVRMVNKIKMGIIHDATDFCVLILCHVPLLSLLVLTVVLLNVDF
jgi:hypothetical protein